MRKRKDCPHCTYKYTGKKCKTCGYEEPVKVKAEKPPKPIKVSKTEEELVQQYAKIIMDKQRTRGMVSDKFKEHQSQVTINKDLWQDQDFYFSIVFESAYQKYQFLEFLTKKFEIEANDDGKSKLQIMNGVMLAKKMGCDIKKELAGEYPCGNMELRQFILDEEQF